QPKAQDLAKLKLEQLERDFAFAWVGKQSELGAKEKAAEDREQEGVVALQQLQAQTPRKQQDVAAAVARQEEFNQQLSRLGLATAGALVLLVGALTLTIGLRRLARNQPGAAPYFATGLCSLGLLLALGMTVVFLSLGRFPGADFGPMAAVREQREVAV